MQVLSMKFISKALNEGDYHNNNNRPRDAMKHYVEAMRFCLGMHDRSSRYEEEISHAHFLSVLRICDNGEDVMETESLLKIYQSLFKTPSQRLIDNMICCERIGDLYARMGEYQEALQYYSMENAFAQSADASYDHNYYFCRARIISFERLGQTLFKLDRYEEALHCFMQAKEKISHGLNKELSFMVEAATMNKNITKTTEAIRIAKRGA